MIGKEEVLIVAKGLAAVIGGAEGITKVTEIVVAHGAAKISELDPAKYGAVVESMNAATQAHKAAQGVQG